MNLPSGWQTVHLFLRGQTRKRSNPHFLHCTCYVPLMTVDGHFCLHWVSNIRTVWRVQSFVMRSVQFVWGCSAAGTGARAERTAAARRETKEGRALSCRGAAGLQHEWRQNCSIMKKTLLCTPPYINPPLFTFKLIPHSPSSLLSAPHTSIKACDLAATSPPPAGWVCPSESPPLRVPCVYLGGRPSRALFRHSGVLSVSAVDRGTSGVSALESTSPSPSASPGRSGLSSPPASCQSKCAVIQVFLLTGEFLPVPQVNMKTVRQQRTKQKQLQLHHCKF